MSRARRRRPRASASATSLDETLSSRPRPAPARPPSWSRASSPCCAAGGRPSTAWSRVTFTEKAAGELKLRLRARARGARGRTRADGSAAAGAARRRARPPRGGAHRHDPRASAPTCCASARSRRGVDPRFEVLPEAEARARSSTRAFDGWFAGRARAQPPEGVRRALRRREFDGDGPLDRLREAALDAGRAGATSPRRWRRGRFDRDAAIDALVAEVARARGAARGLRDQRRLALSRTLEPLAGWRGEVALARAGAAARPRRARGGARRPRCATHCTRPRIGGSRAAIAQAASRAQQVLDAARARSRARSRPSPRRRRRPRGAPAATSCSAGRRPLRGAQGARRRARLRRPAAARARPPARRPRRCAPSSSAGFTHFFVDEFQDTDPLQAEILLLLAADDPDVDRLARASGPRRASSSSSAIPSSRSTASAAPTSALRGGEASSCGAGGAACVAPDARASARVPEIQARGQRRVRAADDRRPDGAQARYVPLAAVRADAARGQPAVVALPVPEPYGAARR